MKNKTLLQTNLLVCFIIITGFVITSIISYQSNIGIFEKDAEMVSALSSEGLYNEITSVFSQPVSVSLTMANDSLLKDFLIDEEINAIDDKWQERMRDYLNTYKEKYEYDSVFLVSSATNNYYHFAGLDRVLEKGNAENEWYYNFLMSDEEYSLNVDNDEATNNSITVFVNCKIKGNDGETLGVVGVGMRVNSLQALFGSYEEKYGVSTYLVNSEGIIQISAKATGHENKNLFDIVDYGEVKDSVLQNRDTQENFWYSSDSNGGYVVSRFEPNLKWHLVVENNTAATQDQLHLQLMRNIIIISVIILLVLITITTVIKKFIMRISELTVSQELEYQRLLHETTGGLYENIYEFDITHRCAGGAETKKYFKELGMSEDTPYDQALQVIAKKRIKEEYRQGYIDEFESSAVVTAYRNGVSNLVYDLMISDDGQNYHWMRIHAQIFYWNSDSSVRMITYRRNIDDEKKRELKLLDDVQRDQMTGLYNKPTTERLIELELANISEKDDTHHAFLIFDIDDFKTVNDTMGHGVGDIIINEIAAEIKAQFRETDIVGRVGGDEFAVLMKNVDDFDSLSLKLSRICSRISSKGFGEDSKLLISCSIGMSVYPQNGSTYLELHEKADQALYHAKKYGKRSFVMFDECVEGYSFHARQRDLETLMNNAADGLAQYACTDPLKMLYFNPKCVELFGISAATLSDPAFDPISIVHADDYERVCAALQEAIIERKPFEDEFRIRSKEGRYITLKLKGFFLSELYKNKYPIFYALYMKQSEQDEQ